MANIALRQIRAVIAVCEEGSFTRAAERENATQSGISQHVATVDGEDRDGARMFDDLARVAPTKGILHDVHLSLYAGEVLGIAGLVGAGRTELARAIMGADPKTSVRPASASV